MKNIDNNEFAAYRRAVKAKQLKEKRTVKAKQLKERHVVYIQELGDKIKMSQRQDPTSFAISDDMAKRFLEDFKQVQEGIQQGLQKARKQSNVVYLDDYRSKK